MKLLIISDSHGNIANIKHVMGFAKQIKAEAVIHCGDWDNVESVEALLSFGIPLYSVLGNADVEEGIEDYLKFNTKKFSSYLLELNIDGVKIGVIHRANLKDEKLKNFKIIFSGHYHSKDETMVDFTTFIRPGALINGINFAVYETTNNRVEFFNE